MAHLYNIHDEAVAITDLRSLAYRTSIEFPPNYFQAGPAKSWAPNSRRGVRHQWGTAPGASPVP